MAVILTFRPACTHMKEIIGAISKLVSLDGMGYEMTETSPVCVRVPNDLLVLVDERVFERRKRRGGGRSASRTAVIIDLIADALVQPGAKLGDVA